MVLLDLLMPEVGGLEVLEAVKPYRPLTEFIIVTAVDEVSPPRKPVSPRPFSAPRNLVRK